jgi:hypothetical protein
MLSGDGAGEAPEGRALVELRVGEAGNAGTDRS